MTPPDGKKVPLEDHYLKSRIPILIALAIPPAVAVWSKVRLDQFQYHQAEEIWLVARFALPLALMAMPGRAAQRTGLVALNLLLVAGMFR